MRSAYVDCKATEQVVTKCTDPDPELSSRPAYVDCKAAEQLVTKCTSPELEKVIAIGERNGWAKVRAVRAGQDVEGYALESCLTYGEPPPLEQPTEGQPQSTEGQAPGPAGQPDSSAAITQSYPVAQPQAESAARPPQSSEAPSLFCADIVLTLGYLGFAILAILVAFQRRRRHR